MSEAILKAMTNVGRSATVVELQAACDAIGPEVWADVRESLAALNRKPPALGFRDGLHQDLLWCIDECVAGDDLVQAWFAPTGPDNQLESHPVLIVAVDDNGEMFDVLGQRGTAAGVKAAASILEDCFKQFRECAEAEFLAVRTAKMDELCDVSDQSAAARRVARDVEGGVL